MSDNHIRILLIEDNPGDERLIKEMLRETKSAQFTLEWRNRLSSGLQKLAEDGADVVLLDLGLPDSHGLDTYETAQSQFPGVPIVVLSGLQDESVAVTAVRSGAQDYLVKGQIDGKLLARSMMYAIERKRSEMAMEKLRYQIELILNSAGDGIFGLDLSGNHTFINPSAAKMLGYEVSELIGLNSHAMFHHSRPDGSVYPASECPICSALNHGNTHIEETELFWRKDGSSFPISYTTTPIMERDKITGAVVSFRDITVRKQAEEALRASEKKYRLLFDNMVAGCAYCRMLFDDMGHPVDFVYLSVNKSFEMLTGMEDVLGEKVTGAIPGIKEAHPELFEIYGRVVLTGQPEIFEIKFKPSGVWFSISVYSTDKEHFVAIFVDITERKRTEILLRARMRLMDFAATHSLEEVLQKTLDEIGEIVDSPIGFYHFVGEDQKTLLLQAWSTRTLKEFCAIHGKGLHYNVEDAGVWVDCLQQRRPVIHNDYLSLHNRKGMPEGHAQVDRELVVPIMRSDRIVAILGVGNKPSNYTEKDTESVTYMADVAWHIVGHKRAEEAIVRAKEEWERTFASVPDLIVILDNQHRILQMNDTMAQRLGKSPKECVGLACYKVVHGTDEPPPFCPHSATLKDGKQHRIEIHEDRLGGDFVVTSTPLYDEQGQPIGSVHVAHDITERKEAEKALQRAHDELETRVVERTAELMTVNESLDAEITERKIFEERQSHLIRELEIINRELDDFAHIVSHDLQAPLRAIRSLSNWVLQDHADAIGENGKEKLLLLDSRIDHLRDLIDGILEYSRIGRLRNEVVEVDLCDLVDKVIKSILCPKNIRITIDNQLPVVTCDMVRIGQVFQNLIDNAIKYMDKQEGEIGIGCAGDNKQWTFSVADNGPGIERKHYDRIFQLFQSLHGDEKKGMGAGLAITKKIVEMHGGRIWIDSEVGRGSTVFFTVPRPAASEGIKE